MSHPKRPLDLAQIRAALSVRETGTVTRAADHLGLSQPAVSRLVAALELELGFLVFRRSHKRMLVTERGRYFLDEAQAAMRSMARLGAVAGELRRGNYGLLRVAAISPLALGLVSHAIAAHVRRRPGVTVDIEVLGRSAQLEELRAGRIDIGLAAMPFNWPDLRVEPILEADAVCTLRADHPLARRAVLRPQDIANEPLVVGRPDTIMRQRLDDAFRQSNIVPNVVSVVDNSPMGITLIAAGVGITVTHAFPREILPANLVTRRFHPRIRFTYAIVSQASDTSAAVADFSATLRTVARTVSRTSLPRGPR